MKKQLGQMIGIGGTADVFMYGEKSVIKLFKPGFGKNLAENEISRHIVVQKCALPVPKLLDVVTVQDRKGLVYPYIDGMTMFEHIKRHPFKMKAFARDMAALHVDISSCSIDTGLPLNKEDLGRNIKSQDFLPSDSTKFILSYLDSLPVENKLCHGDFHPDNILIENDRYWIIDWMTASKGSPTSDIMRTMVLFGYGTSPKNNKVFQIITKAFGKVFFDTYFDCMIKTQKINKNEIFKWELPVLAARLVEGISDTEIKALLKRIHDLTTLI